MTNLVRKVPMSREEALLVLAFENGVRLNRYLTGDELTSLAGVVERVRRADALAEAAPSATKSKQKKRGSRSTPSDRQVVLKISDTEKESIPEMMVPIAKQARTASEVAYPLIHVLENSMRDLIERILAAQYGDDWWDEVPQNLQDKAEARRQNERDEHWHTPRGSEPIQYIDLMDLPKIICDDDLWEHFESILPNQGFVENLARDINVSRRVVAHMNALPKDEVKTVQARFRTWAKTLKNKESEIPD